MDECVELRTYSMDIYYYEQYCKLDLIIVAIIIKHNILSCVIFCVPLFVCSMVSAMNVFDVDFLFLLT